MRRTKALAFLTTAIALPWAEAAAVELRLGMLGHDVGVFGGEVEQGPDINAEVLFDSPAILDIVGSPRPHVGVSLNTHGYTSQAYAGLTWGWDLPSSLFIEFSLGGAVHNGETDPVPGHKALGSHVLFRESLSIGVRLNENLSVSLMLDHISNANLADYNEGLDNLGIRFGYRF